jgi:hypothetical protein
VKFLVEKMILDDFLYKYICFTPSTALPAMFLYIYLSRGRCTVATFHAAVPTDRTASAQKKRK